MNLATTNIRGAGRSSEAKASMIRRLIKENNVAFYAIQETQLSSITNYQIGRLWDNSAVDFAIADAVGRSGGLISVWNPTVFNANLRIIKQNFIIIGGKVTGVDGDFFIVNIYAPNDDSRRKHLWHELLEVRESFEGFFVFLGDFNEVRFQEERLNSVFNPNNALAFNNFISLAGLSEYNMGGAKFTYINPDGSKKSKLDRIFVCDGFMDKWPNAKQSALPRGKLDHRPLILQVNIDDFGPTPFRFFNTWLLDPELADVVKSVTSSRLMVHSHGLSLAGNLKSLKDSIKDWRRKKKEVDNKLIVNAKTLVNNLEVKAESGPLNEEEKRQDLTQLNTSLTGNQRGWKN
ncbi:uncharacterized protein LOC110924948 [Helianthus annuus]|uniref:uncharacterized protein LOC110924948 n=1 Tax=Helianthus annuus TaxID=4232 RepID=UPI000B904A56|nr:uncharacterized protein LOC110924948 [Helianthus annuus]